MRIGDDWLVLESVESTQTVAAGLLGSGKAPDVVFARDQTLGRGRFGREWVSVAGESLTMSLVFTSYIGHPKPWLIGMAVGLAVAMELDCQIQWPNDLVIGGRKLGGVLTEMQPESGGGLIPIVGVGLNLNQSSFPDPISSFATSLIMERGEGVDPEVLARRIVLRVQEMAEPDSWEVLSGTWVDFDDTPGKVYKTSSGALAIAEGISASGELVARVDGEVVTIMAAEAIFGPTI